MKWADDFINEIGFALIAGLALLSCAWSFDHAKTTRNHEKRINELEYESLSHEMKLYRLERKEPQPQQPKPQFENPV